MVGLSGEELVRLEAVIARRVGVRCDPKKLVEAYLAALAASGFRRTVGDGPVPTSLTAERSLVLIEVSRQLGRVIEDFEIQALFRVSQSTARSMRTTLLATYSDDTDALTLDWSLRGARQDGREKTAEFTGTAIVLTSEDRRDALSHTSNV